VLAVSWAGSARAEDGPSLTVMTYNLRYASDTPPNAWGARRPVAAAMVRELKPDLIGTQEGLYRQLVDLDADLPEYRWIGLGREGGSHGEYMAVFYRPERFEALEYDHFWLSDTPDRIGSASWGNQVRRMVTWVRFLDREANREFVFVNTHLDHQSQPSREKSAELILERLKKLEPKGPQILVADFNAAAGKNPVYDKLVNAEAFVDTWTVAKKQGEALGTFHNYRGPQAGGGRIDWILLRGPWQVESSEVVTFSQDGQYPSDHFPVMARLRWSPTE
jgi:endonuclease/exonuclease/phosphatase family metal-dependent hydrolase